LAGLSLEFIQPTTGFNFGVDGIIAGDLVSAPNFREDYVKEVDFGNGIQGNVIPAEWLSIFAAV
jgi:hypothetical protein